MLFALSFSLINLKLLALSSQLLASKGEEKMERDKIIGLRKSSTLRALNPVEY